MNINQIKDKIVLGIQNYCKNNHFQDVILGLSGGLDSALVLALACEALGNHHVHTLMMKTKYTSIKSIQLAQKIAAINHVEHKVLDIQPLVELTLNTFDFKPQNPLTEQNIQARIRGNILMAYSNEKKYLPLACSNKSEISLGYCTLYGDTCGGLAPIGDVYKTTVYQLAALYNQKNKYPIPEEIINRIPTAELALNQKDTDSLPPYEVLDDILKKYIYNNNPIPKDKKDFIESIKKQYEKNSFKRQQLPPIILID